MDYFTTLFKEGVFLSDLNLRGCQRRPVEQRAHARLIGVVRLNSALCGDPDYLAFLAGPDK